MAQTPGQALGGDTVRRPIGRYCTLGTSFPADLPLFTRAEGASRFYGLDKDVYLVALPLLPKRPLVPSVIDSTNCGTQERRE